MPQVFANTIFQELEHIIYKKYCLKPCVLFEKLTYNICYSVKRACANRYMCEYIIGRLFENQNLNDVMSSVYMKKANEYLEKLSIQGSIN